jgi:MFS family permease
MGTETEGTGKQDLSGQSPPWYKAVRGNVLMLGVVSFFTDVSSEMIYPLLPVFFTGLVPAATAAVYVGLMDGIAESVSSLLKIFSGRLSDALDQRKPIAVAGYGISTLCRPLMALATGGWHVVALRFGDRVGKGIRTPARDALISQSTGSGTRGLAFSFHRAMDHAGAVTGPLIAAVILYAFLGEQFWQGHFSAASARQMQALRWLFALALVPGLAAMLALISGVTEVSAKGNHLSEKSLSDPQAGSARLPPRFYLYLASVTLFALGNSSDLFIVFYAKTRFDFGLGSLLVLWVVLHISKIVFSLPGGICSDKYGRRVVIAAGWIVYVGVYAGLAMTPNIHILWVLIVAYGIYYGLTEGAERALVADFVPARQLGKAYGLYHGAIGLAALPASLLFGVFWMQLGPQVAFTIGASLAGSATLLLTVMLARPILPSP